jgi:integral membrane protein
VLRFRVMAWLTGVMLLALTFYAIPMQVFAGDDGPVGVVGAVHGWLYVGYLVTVFQLAYQSRWSLVRGGLVAAAGVVPFASFVAERKVVHQLEREGRTPPAGGTA